MQTTAQNIYEKNYKHIKMNQNVKYLGQRSSRSNVIVWTHTHTKLTAVPGSLKCSIHTIQYNRIKSSSTHAEKRTDWLYITKCQCANLTNVQTYLAKGRIAVLSPLAAAKGFVRSWPHLIHGSLDAHESAPQTGSRSVEPFLYSSATLVRTQRQTHRPRYVRYL